VKDNDHLYYIVVGTLALVMVAVIAILLVGLFDARVDNDKIFAILGPAFQTIVGCFVGVLGSRVLNSNKVPPQ
jgi:hypothetical protein